MVIKVITIGKPALSFADKGIYFYLDRIKKCGWKIEWLQLKGKGIKENTKAQLDKSDGCYRIALDEKGSTYDTNQFSEVLKNQREHSKNIVAFIIGGAEGHSDQMRSNCDLIISLSKLTYQHELATLTLAEQIYRVQMLQMGHPYHRAN